ncbi:hypothetical protein HPB47_024448 [Ixodes persulcatus]|uniref:Uncharacterized protein n=1 Tax=Ixodes persulcatus TaxID=34615 RepID=A0AC60Q692_IXOPE|nr:hypothetical protein HPB47_024448 [Ixodes persulcatus]
MAKTWFLIRHLLDPTNSKNPTSQTPWKIVHDFPGTNEEILTHLKSRYFGEALTMEYSNYGGIANKNLDRPITTLEIIQNGLFRNLDLESYADLTRHLNEVWASDKLPADLSNHHPRCIGPQHQRSFDTVSRKRVLKNLESPNCGKKTEKTYNYVKDFLCNRTATIGVESICSDIIQVLDKGTPQGSVLSPTLSNLAMRKLSERLDAISLFKHSLYAEDLAIWTTSGSEGEKQDGLQEAIRVTQEYLKEGGLHCAPEKSELLLTNSRRKRKSSTDI